MEELGGSKLTKPSAHSKSSEHLDRLGRHSTGPGRPDRDEPSASYFVGVREAHHLEGGRKKQTTQDPEFAGQKNAQGQTQNQTQKKALLKQSSGEDAPAWERSSCGSNSPLSNSSSRARVHSASPGCHGPVTDELGSGRKPSEATCSPPLSRGQEVSEREIKSTVSTPTRTKVPCENTPSSR